MNRLLNTKLCEKENIQISNYFENICTQIKKENKNDKTLFYLKEKINNINKINISKLDEDKKAYYVKKIDENNIDYKKYGKKYNDKDFNKTVSKYKSNLGIKPLYYAFLLYYALPKVTLIDKTIIIGALGYLISPLDLIPDFIPVVGLLDDISVLAWAAYRIGARVDDEVRERARRQVMSIFGLTEEEINNILNN